MVQAARSGKQNIAEASVASATSAKTELKLTNVAKASLQELLIDYEDYLRTRNLVQWSETSIEVARMRELGKQHNDSAFFVNLVESRSDQTVANIAIVLIHQADYLLCKQLEYLEERFITEGGFSEKMSRVRIDTRKNERIENRPSCPKSPISPIIKTLSTLGQRLETFGCDDRSRQIIDEAVAQNEWFTPQSICRAIDAIRRQMLQRDKLEAWAANYPIVPHKPLDIAIIMAGNIPAVGFADMLCVLVAGDIPHIKPSSKDRVLMEFLADEICRIDPTVQIEKFDPARTYDGIIATGGESANLHFRSMFGTTPTLLRSSRHSVAVLSSNVTAEEWQSVADDIFTYDGLGCRNVSLIFAPEGLKIELAAPKMSQPYHNNYLQCRALMTLQGVRFEELGEAIITEVAAPEFPQHISRINIYRYSSLEEVEKWLDTNQNRIQCCATNIAEFAGGIRLGEAQQPTLNDYADGVDIMKFLLSLQKD